uniref:BTB domain-containing protein n=1 Tax=Meloidogyne hapla TaxID=6305 RepID=A0A1I8BWB7_MELHA
MFTDNTDLEFINAKIVWKINNINRLTKLMKIGDYVSSRVFFSSKNPSILWRLRVYPNGYLSVSPGDVYVSIIQVGLKEETECIVRASYYIYALQTSGISKEIGRFTEDFKNMSESSKCMINMMNSHLADGSIKLVCEVEYLSGNKMEYNENDCLPQINSFKNIWLKETFTDCAIQIGCELIKTHRCVLAENSEVFRVMFEQKEMIEAQSGIVKIDDCSPECFRAMLEYFYTGNISKSIMDSLCVDLFAISHKYAINHLKVKCERFMALNLGLDNFTQYCRIIEFYGSSILEEACVKFIVSNRNNFLIGDEWKKLKSTFSELAHRLLEAVITEIDKWLF